MSPRDPPVSLPPQGWDYKHVLLCLLPTGMDFRDPSQDPMLIRQVLPIEESSKLKPEESLLTDR